MIISDCQRAEGANRAIKEGIVTFKGVLPCPDGKMATFVRCTSS